MEADMNPHGSDLRKGRWSQSGGIYLTTTVTHNRNPWLHSFAVGRQLINVLRSEVHRADTLAFVVMPDHLHWLLRLQDGVSLSRVMADVKSISARRINNDLSRAGPLWQAGYHDCAIRKDEDLTAVARYIIANPLRAGLVSHIGDYPLWDAVWL
jgi:REP element-mobilizing transposase RayT